ncbi:MAG TPA: hypothetical protein PKD78_13090 [Saprospiraceae bacterium]|nr:hypothetical protein [Saprospiraceae bacterium]
MRLKPALLLFSFVGILGTVFFLKAFRTPPGDPDPKKEAALMQAILQGVKSLHFQPKAIDDAFSTQVYDLYLKDIDSGKRFFTRRDIDMLQPFREQLDDQALVGTFQFFDISVTLLDQSLTKTQGWYREILANPMDFSKNETLEADGKKLDWAKSDQELRTRWERWMKYEVLSRITEEQDKQEKADYKGEKKDFATLETEQRKKVLDTYDKWYKRMQKLDRMKRLETYLNAITNVFDPHTGYYSPKEKQNFDIQMSGKLEGIGARLQSDGEKTSVTEIVPGESWTWETRSSGVRTIATHAVAPREGGGSTVTLSVRMEGLTSPAVWLLAGKLVRSYVTAEAHGLTTECERRRR